MSVLYNTGYPYSDMGIEYVIYGIKRLNTILQSQ